jgi:hypothetical protein
LGGGGVIEVKVTWEHIAKGERDSCVYCPVAIAMTGAFGIGVPASCGTSIWSLDTLPDGTLHEGWFPKEVTKWIMAFDRGDLVAPITFQVEEGRNL